MAARCLQNKSSWRRIWRDKGSNTLPGDVGIWSKRAGISVHMTWASGHAVAQASGSEGNVSTCAAIFKREDRYPGDLQRDGLVVDEAVSSLGQCEQTRPLRSTTAAEMLSWRSLRSPRCCVTRNLTKPWATSQLESKRPGGIVRLGKSQGSRQINIINGKTSWQREFCLSGASSRCLFVCMDLSMLSETLSNQFWISRHFGGNSLKSQGCNEIHPKRIMFRNEKSSPVYLTRTGDASKPPQLQCRPSNYLVCLGCQVDELS